MSTITYLTRIEFGSGVRAMLPDALKDFGITRPLVVTDAGLVASGLVEQVTRLLPPDHVIFDGTPGNPTEEAVEKALDAWRDGACDGIVAVGGGSSIDLAKGVALLARHPGPLEQYAAVLGGLPRITAAVAPVIAVPTTAGTGSEVGRASLLTLKDGRKLGFISPHLIPKLAIVDPDLTLGLPAGLTAATGMDALSHCIETFLSPRDNPPAEAIALDGAGRVMRHLRRAVAAGDDATARHEMMMAALQGGLCFQKGLGAVHALSHPLGGLKAPALHHGTLNAVLMPAVLRFNAGHVGDKYARLAAAMGLPAGMDLADAVAALSRDIGLPATLSAMGTPRDVLPRMAEMAVIDHSSATNPRPADAGAYLGLLEEAF
ncbi:iron-containing alcohol dehydrogenase [Xanthobacter sp. KR7-65]|uniref:iron-containing alcohol dehydrogenase n=1 Tax=Xanthobacter sp. KR7-65 TaxID=3156612 RepID=UPI0032B450CC